MSSGFRICAKNFFLTYPRCSESKDALKTFLLSLGCSACVVGAELHEDGTPHLHAVVSFARKKDIKNARFFDFNNHHGSYEGCRDVLASIAYTKKDGDFIEWGDVPKAKRKWTEALSASSKEETMQLISEISPRDFILNNQRIRDYCDWKFKPVQEEYVPKFTNFIMPDIVQVWKDQLNIDRPKSLIIWGPSRLGKTELARSLGKHMYFNGLFNADKLDSDAEYAIFDDWDDWSKFFGYKQWIGAQREFDVTDKYRSKRRFIWGKPCIILANTYPNFIDQDWIYSNCFVFNIINKCFI